ncbi:ABA4-like family protein [Nocardia sp. CDC153]|uniref:ABA4-like family protein n=1 Tax=Nocardia sp. CDC153 TaxID=3112167 RepID=UPI002DBEE973|nr:ABA4-like family protein [Nocardia sp. CDC153]MEC3957032.1 ABA4-like family protein [Nocardia sp. CDC153]
MTTTLFSLVFWLAAPFWAAMILAPHRVWTRRLVASPWIVLPPLLVYLALMLPHFARFFAAMLRPDLTTLRDILGDDWGAATVWAHLIAFDLFIGRWIYLDSRSRSISPLLVSPILFVTILLSPIGLLSYLLVRELVSLTRRGSAGLDAVTVDLGGEGGVAARRGMEGQPDQAHLGVQDGQ